MKKFIFMVLSLSISVVLVFAGPGAKETLMIKSPGIFNAAEYKADHQARWGWLMGEAASLSPESVFTVEVTGEELKAIERYRCETCGEVGRQRQKQLIGMVKPIGVSFADLEPAVWSGGRYVWTVAIFAKGAAALRAHITNLNLPENAGLYIYNPEGTAFGPYTSRGPNGDGEVWTNTVFGSLAYVQLHYTGSNPGAVNCRLESVGYLGDKFLIPFMQKAPLEQPGLSTVETHCPENADCVEDASCYGTGTYSAINSHKYAVAYMQWISGAWIYSCTGGLLNNTNNDFTPYFLTANHCIGGSKAAKNLECYFQYWTASCHGACYDPVGVCPRTLGAAFLKGSSKTSDFTLLRLNQTPPAGSVFLGWSTTPVATNNGFALYRLSHPSGAPQAFSKHLVESTYVECRSWPVGKWIYSQDDIGATEGGSSGSPVCNASGQVVGQLTGGCGYNVNDVCDADNNRTVDGAFANYYSLIAQWLSPI